MQIDELWSALVTTVSEWPAAVKLALCLVGICVLVLSRHRDDARP